MARKSMLGLAIAVCACLLSRFTAASEEQRPVVSQQEAQTSGVAPPVGPQVAIEVHGHWTIEVRNPNVTLAERRKVENAYVGGNFLPRLLGRSVGVVAWAVGFGGAGTALSISEGGGLSPPTVPTSGPNSGKLVLSGSLTNLFSSAGTSASLSTMTTNIVPCAACSAITFTQANLSPAVTLGAGQLLTVTVVISFS